MTDLPTPRLCCRAAQLCPHHPKAPSYFAGPRAISPLPMLRHAACRWTELLPPL